VRSLIHDLRGCGSNQFAVVPKQLVGKNLHVLPNWAKQGKINGRFGGRKRIVTAIQRREGWVSKAFLAGGRTLLCLTSFLILMMPWTEYFWHFDKFMRGGQDFELGMLAVATIFCLVLVLLEQGKRCWALLMAMRRLILFAASSGKLIARHQTVVRTRRPERYPEYGFALQGYSLPLRT
jgi:hypothetical protein